MPRQQSEDELRIRGQAPRSPRSSQGDPLERNSKLEDEEELDLIRCGIRQLMMTTLTHFP